jgi:cell division protein ZapA (FtsZ GTPase activity inhibitor)
MKAKRIQVKLGGRLCELPPPEGDRPAQPIADQVNERLRRIEESAARIDTIAFALEAAFSFAAEAEALRDEIAALKRQHERERNEESQSLMAALEQVTTRLERIVERGGQGA